MCTRQEIFDIAWTGLKSQGFERSLSDVASGCAYRGEDGLRCAIGWCIPDKKYNRRLEGRGADDPDVLEAAGIDERDSDFADDLQVCHDFEDTPSGVEEALRNFAREHDLTIPGER